MPESCLSIISHFVYYPSHSNMLPLMYVFLIISSPVVKLMFTFAFPSLPHSSTAVKPAVYQDVTGEAYPYSNGFRRNATIVRDTVRSSQKTHDPKATVYTRRCRRELQIFKTIFSDVLPGPLTIVRDLCKRLWYRHAPLVIPSHTLYNAYTANRFYVFRSRNVF